MNTTSRLQKPRLIIVHCFGRTSQERWYQSTAAALASEFTVVTPDMPQPMLGYVAQWLPALQALDPDEQTILVGHSLGGTLLLRYLEQAKRSVAGFYTVAAPIDDLDRDKLHATGFFDTDFDWDTIRRRANKRVVIASKDDDTVPFWQAEQIAAKSAGELMSFDDKGHFKQDIFPELVARLTDDWVKGQ